MLKALLIIFCVLFYAHSKLLQAVAFLSEAAHYHYFDIYDANQTRSHWGEITAVGLRQQQNLGKILRKQYIQKQGLLSDSFSADQYEHYSVGMDSTIMGVAANFKGLYPLGKGLKIIDVNQKYHIPPYNQSSDLQDVYALPQGPVVQPIKFNSKILLDDCPNEYIEFNKNINYQKNQFDQMKLTYAPFFSKMAKVFNISTPFNFTTMGQLASTVQVDRYLGRSLPADFTKQDLKNMQHLYMYWGLFGNKFNLSKAYNTGKYNQVLTLFDNRVKNPSAGGLRWTTLAIYVGDLLSAINDLNISSSRCVEQLYRRGQTSALNCATSIPFSSNLIFELHQQSTGFEVKLRFNGKYVNLCQKNKVNCSYNEWKLRMKSYILNDVSSICGRRGENEQVYEKDKSNLNSNQNIQIITE